MPERADEPPFDWVACTDPTCREPGVHQHRRARETEPPFNSMSDDDVEAIATTAGLPFETVRTIVTLAEWRVREQIARTPRRLGETADDDK